MKTLHTLVQEALRAESTTEWRFAYVDYYLSMIEEMAIEAQHQAILEAEAYLQDPFVDMDDLPF